jgi:NADH-quinone oxidoreductase subunit N
MITDYRPLIPYIILTVVGLLIALLDAADTRQRRLQGWLGWLTAAGAIAALALDWRAPQSAPWQGIVLFDGFTRAFDALFLTALAIVAVGSAAVERKMRFAGEYYALLVFSTMGLMLMASAGGLLMLYLGLELSTLCLFALVGLRKREAKSAEAALKFFVLGAVASAVILYGASILFGVLGSTQFDQIAAALRNTQAGFPWALWVGMAFVIGGLAFKIAAVPFHLWAPDVYEGAPPLVTAYLSTASKAGAFAGLLRFLLVGMAASAERWIPVLVVLSALSMVLGNLVALRQTDLKRLLAYSGVAQAGYILVAVAAASDMGLGAALTYLFLYMFANLAGFMIIQAVETATGSTEVTALRGLHRRSPLLAFSMLIVLFSLGGIPPLAGFVGKLYLFAAGWESGLHWLVLLGALTSVVSLYYYLMVALQVYIRDPADDRKLPINRPLALAVGICVLGTLVIGIYPRPWVELGQRAATSAFIGAGDKSKADVARLPAN